MSGQCGSAPGRPPGPLSLRDQHPLADDKRAGTGDPARPLEDTGLRSLRSTLRARSCSVQDLVHLCFPRPVHQPIAFPQVPFYTKLAGAGAGFCGLEEPKHPKSGFLNLNPRTFWT